MPSMLALMNCIRKGKGVLKYLNLLISAVILILGICSLAVGGYIIGYYKDYLSLVGNKYVTTAAFFVTVGLFVLIIGILGIVGSVQCSTAVITAYGSLLVIFFVVEIIIGSLFYGYKNEVTSAVDKSMKDGLTKYNTNNADKKFYDWIQPKYECCGNKGPSDWKTSRINVTTAIPKTCCKQNTTESACSEKKSNVYQAGCQAKFEKFMKDELVLIGGIGIGIAVLELIGILLAFTFRKAIIIGAYEEISDIIS